MVAACVLGISRRDVPWIAHGGACLGKVAFVAILHIGIFTTHMASWCQRRMRMPLGGGEEEELAATTTIYTMGHCKRLTFARIAIASLG